MAIFFSATTLAATPLIGVITMAPGKNFWERFGHNAIVVSDPATGHSTAYNFGAFDMNEPGFVSNFIQGRMRYALIALPVEEDLASYRDEGRGASVQWLNLDDVQTRALVKALKINAQPENAHYRYDYFTDNCATRVRDAINTALGGQLRQQLTGRSLGDTWRTESVRLAWPEKWLALGFDLALSDKADQPLTRWDEAFIPMRLHDSMREVTLTDGRPLVAMEKELLPHLLPLPPNEMPRWRTAALFIGAMAGLLIVLVGRWQRRGLAALALPFWLLSGLAGCVLAFLWLASEHRVIWANENLLLLNPLCLLLLVPGWQTLRGRPVSRHFGTLLWMVAGAAAVAAFLKFLPFRIQDNLAWVLLLLPVHLALAKSLAPKR